MIYLDYNATTPMFPEALEVMLPYLEGDYGNPSSIHASGRRARAALDDARDRLADLLRVKPHELVFTGGGTEADNLAILGLARAHAGRGRHLVTAATEHHAVLEAFEQLQKREGFELTVLPVDAEGLIAPDEVEAALRADTVLVSIMSANNETGVRLPVGEFAAICRERGVLFHTDMVQSFGKEMVLPGETGVDAAAFAAHKFGGPKGVGLLYLRSGVPIHAIGHGGRHENQRRPGTENVAGIAAMATAAELALGDLDGERARQGALRDRLEAGIAGRIPAARFNGHRELRLANTSNVSFPDVDGEMLLIGLDLEGVSVSSGSACMVGSVQASHVLLAMGVAPELAGSTVRFSLGKGTTDADIDRTLDALEAVLERQKISS